MIDLNAPIRICPGCGEVFDLAITGPKCACTTKEEHNRSMTALKQLIEKDAINKLRR